MSSIWNPGDIGADTLRGDLLDPVNGGSRLVADNSGGGKWTNLKEYIQYIQSANGATEIGVSRTETGTVPTTLNLWIQKSKLNLRKDFGMVGDGITDESNKLIAAFAAIQTYGGGELEFGMPARMRITQNITIPENLTFTGESREVSELYLDGASARLSRIYVTHTDINRLNLHMRDINLVGTAATVYGIELQRADYFDIEHCGFIDFQNPAAAAFYALNTYRGGIRYCHFETIRNRGILWVKDPITGVGCNATWIEGNEFIGNNNDDFVAVEITGQNINIRKNDFSGSGHAGNGRGLDLVECEGVLIEQNYIERWGAAAILANSGVGNRRIEINNNVLHALSTEILNFNNTSSPNTRLILTNNRFADATALQTCAFFGTSTLVQTSNNDPAASVTFSDLIPTDGRDFTQLIYRGVWDPASIAADGVTSTEVGITGVRVGDPCIVGLSSINTGSDIIISAFVRTVDIVRVVILNKEGSPVDLGSGTLTVVATKVTV